MLNDELIAVDRIDRESNGDRAETIRQLRAVLPLDSFGEVLMRLPDGRWPKLSSVLPNMVSAAEQKQWTSRSDYALLQVTANWMRVLGYNYQKVTGKPMDGAPFLDFGCGWGRVSRLMLYYTDAESIFGVDPWDRSIDLCRQTGLGDNFRLSDRIPESLPVPERSFALLHAFSVFTHLSPEATVQCLRTMRRYVRDDGVLVITIRPPDIWNHLAAGNPGVPAAEMLEAHRTKGIAFLPHPDETVGTGHQTYGETSLTPEWLAKAVPEWKTVTIDGTLEDPFQRFVFMQPA